jgi:hypothetical protein
MNTIESFLKEHKNINIILNNNDLRDYFINIAPIIYSTVIDNNSDIIITDDLNINGYYINYEKSTIEKNKETISKELLLYPLKIFQLLTK